MHRVCADATARGIDVGKIMEASKVSVLVELVEGLHVLVGVADGNGLVKVHYIAVSCCRCVILLGDVLRDSCSKVDLSGGEWTGVSIYSFLSCSF